MKCLLLILVAFTTVSCHLTNRHAAAGVAAAMLVKTSSTTHDSSENDGAFLYVSLAKEHFTLSYKTSNIYPEIKAILAKGTGDSFKIANPGERWEAGCMHTGDCPSRQLIAIAVSARYLMFSYRQGGIALMNNLVVFMKSGNTLKQCWQGIAATGDLKTLPGMLAAIKTQRHN